MNPRYSVAQVLNDTGPILLDFDGPVCAVFATLTDSTVAAELRRAIEKQGVEIPEQIRAVGDPLEVLRFTATVGTPTLVERVEDELCRAELAAVDGAKPTPYAREVIVAAYEASRPIAIVSNNSAAAIERYLIAHRLTRYVMAIVGRAHADPTLMKPNPVPIQRAVLAVATDPARCVLVGDSVSDIRGGRAAGVRTIGFANKPGKAGPLLQAGADATAEGARGMGELARFLMTRTSG
ncbi:HAD family hydrolase [Micromonospora sp. WMMD558]|uniref:HAD family hydrolase n=1 Tax=Micromonospora sp. WMMD558 TaxID=3403462 RepID=UPI003BF51227